MKLSDDQANVYPLPEGFVWPLEAGGKDVGLGRRHKPIVFSGSERSGSIMFQAETMAARVAAKHPAPPLESSHRVYP